MASHGGHCSCPSRREGNKSNVATIHPRVTFYAARFAPGREVRTYGSLAGARYDSYPQWPSGWRNPVNLRLTSVFGSAALTLGALLAHAETSRFSFDLSRKIVNVSGPQISPDGKVAAFVVTRPNYADDRNESELYLVDLAAGAPRQLTFERRQVSEPRWSPNGRWLAFLAPDSADRSQVWLMPMSGGDAWRITKSKTDV